MADDDKGPRDRKFETLFDGDEIDGKFYGLSEGVTGLDAATGDYLKGIGRLAEIDEVRWSQLMGDGDDGEGADTFADSAAEDFAAGRIPEDLLNPDGNDDDRLVSRAELDSIAAGEGLTVAKKTDKAGVATAIMAARAKAAASA